MYELNINYKSNLTENVFEILIYNYQLIIDLITLS